MTKHKIAFLSYRSDPYSGGQGVYLKYVCEALAKFGHEITIYSGNPLPRVFASNDKSNRIILELVIMAR